jgi:hypothetical protein
VSAVSDAVVCLLDGLDRCGSTVLQSLAVLRSGGAGAGGDGSGAAVLGALEVLRGLSDDRLGTASADECTAFDAVMGHLSSSEKQCGGLELESACVSLFKLGCRNGFVVCARVEAMELIGSLIVDAYGALSSSSAADVLRAGGAVGQLWSLVTESAYKSPAGELRASLDLLATSCVKAQLQTSRKVFTPERIQALTVDTMKVRVMEDPELSVASGYVWTLMSILMALGGIQSLDDGAVLLAAMTLHRRIMPSPLPASWWVSTCDVIDATSVHLGSVSMTPGCLRRMVAASSEMSQSASIWLPVAIDMVKMNKAAGLTARHTLYPLYASPKQLVFLACHSYSPISPISCHFLEERKVCNLA